MVSPIASLNRVEIIDIGSGIEGVLASLAHG